MIIIQNLVKHFGSKAVINNFSYQFPKNANVALVGVNGAGKTTLLNIICGLEEHDAGEVIIPNGCVVAYLPQSPCENPKSTILSECISGSKKLCDLQSKLDAALKDMEECYSEEVFERYEKIEKEFANEGGYALEADAKGILVGLGFENNQFQDHPSLLSGGWQMRLELAKLLINYPNFLILDEPTNHLDLPSLTWLEQYLKSFNGTLLFVSHDRDFLNNLSEITMHMANGTVNVYRGDFDSFLSQKEERNEIAKKEKENLKRKQDHMQSFVDRFRSKATKAKQAQSRLKMIERLKKIESGINVEDDEKKADFKIKIDKPSGKTVLTIEDGSIGYENKVLNKNLDLKIMRGDKIAIIGANGIGKSTLLKSITGELNFLGGNVEFGANVSIGYYSQNQLDVLEPELSVLDNILRLAPTITIQQARSLLGSLLITKDDVKKLVRVISGGEKSKVSIAALLAQKNNFLILDEPTNHLDMSSVETLSLALSNYEGTCLVVSHDRSFISSFSSKLFKMDKHKKAELIDCN